MKAMDTIVSVITVCYNAKKIIEDTMLSVMGQSYDNLEYIIVDGASEDGTADKAQKVAEKSSFPIHIISEKDTGIYNAMNKGVKLSSGDYVVFMNAGDVFCSKDAVKDIFTQIDHFPDVIYGDHYARLGDRMKYATPHDLSTIISESAFCHQASFTRRSLLVEYPFEEKYRIIADYDFFLKQYVRGATFQYIHRPVVCYDLSGISQTNMRAGKQENMAIRIEQSVLEETDKETEWKKIQKKLIKNKIKMLIPKRIRMTTYKERFVPWYK